MLDNKQKRNSNLEEMKLTVIPDYLKEFADHRYFNQLMKPTHVLTTVIAVLLGIALCGILLRPDNMQNKLFQCHLALFLGVLIGGGSVSGKKVPDAISTGLWGVYSIVTGIALTQLPAIWGQQELFSRMLLLAVPYILIGLFLVWTTIQYLQVQQAKILLRQALSFGLLSIVHVVIFFICIVRIVGDMKFMNVLGKGAVQSIFIGLWLVSLTLICFKFYRRFKGETLNPSPENFKLAEQMIQEIRASRGTETSGIIEIVGGGPAWKGKLWADSLFFVIDDKQPGNEEIYLLKKSEFKFIKCLTSKKKRDSGFLNVQFKIRGESYKGEISVESYHLYERWKQN